MNPIRTIAIIGAGYAGVMAANRLQASLTEAELANVKIVMINPRTEFVDRIRLHQLAAGTTQTATYPLEHVLHRSVEVVLGEVTQIVPEDSQVLITTADGTVELEYHILIYAAGSGALSSIPGVALAHSVGSHDGALSVQQAVRELAAGGRIVIIGGGATGVEVASELAESHPAANIEILSAGPLLRSMPQRSRNHIKKKLASLSVRITENSRVEHVNRDSVELIGGRKVRSDLTIWAGSFTVSSLAQESGLAVDGGGKLLVTETLQHEEYPNIIGAGDAAQVRGRAGEHLRMGCAVAAPMGGHAAATALAYLRDRPPAQLSVGFFIQCLSLGRHSGFIQHVSPGDIPRSLHLSGRTGAWVKERICAEVIAGIQKERTSPGSYWTVRAPRSSTVAVEATQVGADR
jgi:NADH dehydrogenase